ncbi:MAG: anaerobic ribonucleoside-triphosphate reductase activating protein [Firmicutes bacterium]|nr:anaerobic ribonucleoside-triphosphate reductase activating protein [Bacillota bacterium]
MVVKDVATETLGVKGIVPLSMLDWEGRLVTTLFLGGCNFRCPFCHNASLVLENNSLPDVPRDMLDEALTSKDGWLDGVCITGGEPTINANLESLAVYIKSLGLQVKLDTNGTQPKILHKLIDKGLVDAVALDVKTSFSKYADATRRPDLSGEVKKTISLLIDAEAKGMLEVEFRTTVAPTFVEREDVIEIAKYLAEAGAKRYYLQQFNPKSTMEVSASKIEPYSKESLTEFAEAATNYLQVRLRG